MKLLEDSFGYANQLGQRNGSGAVYLNIFHPDIVQFLSTRKENADEKIRVKTLSLGVVIPDKFYELIKENKDMYLFSPYDVEKEYGTPFAYMDITKEYDNMVSNPNIKKSKIKARELETEISKLQQESGYPYVMNVDTANKSNPVYGKIISSNLCSEIMQVQTPSTFNEDMSYDEIGIDVSCNLGSNNMTNMLNSKDFEKSVDISMRALNTVTNETSINSVPSVRKGNEDYHTVGLGEMGLHTALATNQIMYGSEESIEFIDAYFRAKNFYTIKSSMNIAIETGFKFHEFEKSDYANGEYFKHYIEEEFEFKYPKVKKALKNIKVPTIEDWKELAEQVKKNGLANSYRQAIAPTGSISYVNEASASLHPITHMIEERQDKMVGKTYYPAPQLSDKTIPYYVSAYDTDMRKVIDVYAKAQEHIDQGMSLTMFMRSEIPEGLYEWKDEDENGMTTRDLNKLRNYAWSKGIKSIYYVRTHTDDGDVVGVSECESCVV